MMMMLLFICSSMHDLVLYPWLCEHSGCGLLVDYDT